jgi:hypothetical protein
MAAVAKEWHGVPAADLTSKAATAPPRPAEFRTMSAIGSATFARVHFTGNYGLLCGQYQEQDAQNITKDSAHEMAWTLYGNCGHKIYYYDGAGQLVDQE